MSTPPTGTTSSEAAIFGRLLCNGNNEMSPGLAQYVLTLGFGSEDQARMADLASRNQGGALSPGERDELMSYIKAGHLLALLHSQARRSLKRQAIS